MNNNGLGNIFVFDIETVPDVETYRTNNTLNNINDLDIAKAMLSLRRAESGYEFLKHFQHKIVAISVLLRNNNEVKLWSLGSEDAHEKELITRFFNGIDKYKPILVSYNGSGFDLPVINYRAMLHKVTGKTYFDTGQFDQDFKWNNYINRYHQRHVDLMDALSAYQSRACTSLDSLATMLSLKGKLVMDGSKVMDNYFAGKISDIRSYCEIDVLNTYLVYLNYELLRGTLDHDAYESEFAFVKDSLLHNDNKFIAEFYNAVAK